MRLLVTGSNRLIGSEAVAYFSDLGWDVVGVDRQGVLALMQAEPLDVARRS